MDEKKQELLEIYKLHAELADRVSQRREGANRLFASLLTGLSALFAFFLRNGSETLSPVFIFAFGALGIAICVSWWIVIRSYRQLNSGKFKALHELEKKLSYPFFTREWELLEKGKSTERYWKLTVVEIALPVTFALFFVFVIIYSSFFQ